MPPPSGMARHILAHCSRAARSMNGSLRSRVLQLGDLLVDRLVDQRPRLVRDVDLDAGERDGAVAERELRGEIRLQPPVGGEGGLRAHDDLAAHVGALVEHLAGEIAELLAEFLSMQAGDRSRRGCRPAGDLAGDLAGAVERRSKSSVRSACR